MKESKTTGKQTYALAKNDEGFLALTEHEDPFIQQLCSVRLGTKSTIEESRIERFIDVGKRNKGKLPIPLKYYGAHTGRWAGSDKVNFQNLPSRDKKKKALKNAVVAPDGHFVINCDSSQIEARVLAWLAGQNDVVEQFAKGEDVYSLFATKIYGRPISKANPIKNLADWGETKPFYYGKNRCVMVTKDGIRLPNGLMIRYPDLELNSGKYEYQSRKGAVSLWGGSLVENVVQALARIVVGQQMLKIQQKYRVALTVHDAAVVVVKEAELDNALAYIVECMKWTPDWARGLPVTCEAHYGESYGDMVEYK